MNSNPAVTVFGRLGADPELKYTQSLKAVCSFSLAEQLPGEVTPRWHRIVVWGKQAETCKVQLAKGRPVFVQGQMNTRQFVLNGEAKSQVELTADFIGIPLTKDFGNG